VVYEVSQDIVSSNTYYSNDAFSVYGTPIGRLSNYVPNFIDSSTVRGYVVSPRICIKLSNAFATEAAQYGLYVALQLDEFH
jgi:hypothetical protein